MVIFEKIVTKRKFSLFLLLLRVNKRIDNLLREEESYVIVNASLGSMHYLCRY